MAYSEVIATRVRDELARQHPGDVREIKMYGGLAFMVQDKMCVCVGGHEADLLMVRVGPDRQNDAVQRPGASVTIMKNRPVTGYIDVDATGQQDLAGWVALALDFNAELVDGKPRGGTT